MTFKLQIMASDHMIYDGAAESVSLQTTEGSVGILAHHANIIMAVVPGIVEYVAVPGSTSEFGTDDTQEQPQSGRQQIVVSDGLLKVENGEVMILVEGLRISMKPGPGGRKRKPEKPLREQTPTGIMLWLRRNFQEP